MYFKTKICYSPQGEFRNLYSPEAFEGASEPGGSESGNDSSDTSSDENTSLSGEFIASDADLLHKESGASPSEADDLMGFAGGNDRRTKGNDRRT